MWAQQRLSSEAGWRHKRGMKRKAFALAWELRAERVRGRERPQSPWQPGTPRDPGRLRQSGGGCMRLEDSVVATAGPAPETGCGGEQPRPPAGQGCGARGEPGGGGPQDSRQQRKKFLYCEPHKRIKEVLEEELYIKRDECHIKNPPTVALEGIWSIKRNLPVGGLKPGLPSRNSLLPQAKYYSRHGGLRR